MIEKQYAFHSKFVIQHCIKVMNEKKNPILDKLFQFSLKIIELYKLLIGRKEFIISKQLLRCGTSIGANVNESIAAQTKKDFCPLQAKRQEKQNIG